VLLAACAGAAEPTRQWHALPVEGGADVIARAARIEPGLPAWRVLYEASRRRHGLWGEDAGSARPSAAAPPGDSVVPLPLAPALWRGLLRDGSGVLDGRLALAILADREAALLYRGLAGLDDETLAALAADPDTLQRIKRRHANVFAAFGSRFVVWQGVVAVPGGAAAEPLWEGLVRASTRVPAHFMLNLLEASEGQLAFLYDSLARLDPARQRLALGLPAPPFSVPGAPLRELARAFEAEPAWWRSGRGAFARPDADAARVLREVRLDERGGIAPPASRAFWAAVFDEDEKQAAPAAVQASAPVGMAWLAAKIGSGDPGRRRLRLEQLSFAQRAFGAAAERAPVDAVRALAGLRDTRALLLSLERLGSRDPGLFAGAVAWARSVAAIRERDDRSRAHAGLQGALGVIDRARFAGALDTAAAERLVGSLLQVPPTGGAPWERGLAGWVEAVLLPALAAAVGADGWDADATVLRAMAGMTREAREAGPAFDWEGLWYRAQPERAELQRLEDVRRRQGGRRLTDALAECRATSGSGGQARAGSDRHACAASLGGALVSLVYAAHLGQPDGVALGGADPSGRHVFQPDPWALPTELLGLDVPWHVEGSLLGLETALARLSLHRLDADDLPARSPVIDAVQQRRIAVGAGLANPAELRDADQGALAAAVASGRSRVQALRPGSPDLAAVAHGARLDPWRARALEWLLEHEAAALAGFFSLAELAYLGEPAGGRWDGWGAPDPTLAGLRLRFPAPSPLDDSSGRLPEPALAEAFVDLGVRAAVHLSSRGLPACLAPALVATLLPDLFAEARPLGPDDRLALDAWVRDQPAERLDDVVASLVGQGPLQPAPAPGRTQ
jgi:hypothetical protein